MNDYCTVEEFREYVGDPTGAKYPDRAITRAQGQAIEMLERWAKSAWPNVTGTTGDGTAALPRSETDYFYEGGPNVVLFNVPVIAITAVTMELTPGAITNVDPAQYVFDPASGLVRVAYTYVSPLDPYAPPFLPAWSGAKLGITYTFGHTSTPEAIKSALMRAMRTKLDLEGGRSKVPFGLNLSSYRTEGAEFSFQVPSDDRAPPQPWPWDLGASEEARAYWDRDRPRGLSTI